MSSIFDKTFFKFLSVFLVMIAVSMMLLYFSGSYQLQKEEEEKNGRKSPVEIPIEKAKEGRGIEANTNR